MRLLKDQRGVVGLILLAIAILVIVVFAGFYVYRVRSGQAEPIIDESPLSLTKELL
jgi:hypothetical protein